MRLKIIFSLIFIGLINLFAQSKISFENYSILDGLSNSTVQCLLQDKFGFIWVGTSDGLNRYDGYEFKAYREDDDIPNTIRGSIVFAIYEDKKGNLWIGTDAALNLYDRDKDNFRVFEYDSQNPNNLQFFNAILSIYEDNKNTLWIGKAYHSIVKFNRSTFNFEQIIPDTSGTKFFNFGIFEIVGDSQGRIWASYGQNLNSAFGIKLIDPQKGELPLPAKMQELNIFNSNISPKLNISGDNLFINTVDGRLFKINTNSFESAETTIENNSMLFQMYIDNNGIFWFTTLNAGLIRYNPIDGTKIKFVNDPQNNNSIPDNRLTDIFADDSGVFWVGTAANGLVKFDPNKVPFQTIKINSSKDPAKTMQITAFERSGVFKNKMWVGTEEGIFLFDKNTREIEKADFLKDAIVRAIKEDKDEKLWVGCLNDGLYSINLRNNQIKNYKNNSSDVTSISDNSVRSLFIDRDNGLWVGTAGGLNYYDSENRTFKIFKRLDTAYTLPVYDKLHLIRKNNKVVCEITKVGSSKNIQKQFVLNQPKEVLITSTDEIFNMQVGNLWDFGWLENDKKDTVWIFNSSKDVHAGGDNKNRFIIDVLTLPEGKYSLHYKTDDSHDFSGWNASSPEHPEYWGVQVYEISGEEKKYFEDNLSQRTINNSLPGEFIRTISQTEDGNILVGTNTAGFAILNKKTNEFRQFNNSRQNFTGFSGSRINSFLTDKNGIIWISTFGGLMRFDEKKSVFQNFDMGNGLPTNYLLDLQSDNEGNIWVSTLKGLIKLSQETEGAYTFINYDIKDGIQGYNYIQGASLVDSEGTLFFGGENGFNIFHGGSLNKIPPRIIIKGFKLSNTNVRPDDENSPLSKNISTTDSLLLNYNQNDLSFEFTAVHYSRPEKNQYAYMLEGFDNNWIYDNRRFATYTNLDPGEYKFKILASNSDGIWTKEPKILSVIISPPWWKTVYAYITYFILIVFGLVSVQKIQRNRIVNKERARMAIEEAELRAAVAEAQSRVIQAENDRKTKELEEARNLQLSMLPAELPEIPNLDIAVFMKTATEVGGDYYDFHLDLDGTLTLVIGDATGHGLNAGTMVTATKSLFNSHASNPDVKFTFNEISRCLRQMNLRLLSMCLTIMKIKGKDVLLSAAGMPPALIYRNSESEVEEFFLRGMPLGAPTITPYEIATTQLERGDVILLMSDGFPELFNLNDEMLGYERVKEIFRNIGNLTPEKIISELNIKGTNWLAGREQADDITFVVIKHC